jgi:asparagine synthase (glutamine-hydrolysing)
MCGITGVFHYRNSLQVDAGHLVAMRDALRHRGPDGAGLYVHPARQVGLASTRLAIRDLSSAGHQPFVDAASEVTVAFNGEIYNADELRSELEGKGVAFRSFCDTEVLLRLYCEYGEALLAKINGIFAFAIWDGRKDLLLLARDPLGVKPLYYFDQQGTFAFASETKSLLKFPGMSRRLNEEAVASYLTFACIPAPRTLFRNIAKLPAATLLRVTANHPIELRRYWSPIRPELIDRLRAATEDECVERVRETLSRTVSAQLASDIVPTCSLSGGVDSSSVASLMSRFAPQRMTYFTIGFGERWRQYNEYSYARSVAQHAGGDLVELCITPQAVVEFLENSYADIFDDPNADPVSSLAFTLAKEMRQRGFKVALSGEGAY